MLFACAALMQGNAALRSRAQLANLTSSWPFLCMCSWPSTCDLQLIHWDISVPNIQAVVHAEGLDDMHSRFADSWGSLGDNKGLHRSILPFYHMHLHDHTICTFLTPATCRCPYCVYVSQRGPPSDNTVQRSVPKVNGAWNEHHSDVACCVRAMRVLAKSSQSCCHGNVGRSCRQYMGGCH